MDEETVDEVPVFSKSKTVAVKQKRKAIPAKEKDKAASSTKPKVKGQAAASTEQSKKKTILDLVCEAIEASGENRKGISAQAIKKYIKTNHDSTASNLDSFINKALNKGIESGKLERPLASKDAKGATGYFRLAKIPAPKRKNIKTEKRSRPDDYVSDSETTIKKTAQPRKRTLSDTYLEEMRVSATSTPKPSVKRTMAFKDAKQTKKVPSKKKDTSDTKLVVKKTKRKSMKSYSSDTEVDLENQNTVIAKEPLKKAKPDKPKMEKADSTSKVTKNKVRKLYNEGGKENEAKTKSGKIKTKKQA